MCYFNIIFLYLSIIKLLLNYLLNLQIISVRIIQIGFGVFDTHVETYDTTDTENMGEIEICIGGEYLQ